MDQLSGTSSLVALGGFKTEPAELAQSDAGEDSRDGRERHIERLSDLGAGHP